MQHELDVPSRPAGEKLRITVPAPNPNAPTGPTFVGEAPYSISALGVKIIITSKSGPLFPAPPSILTYLKDY